MVVLSPAVWEVTLGNPKGSAPFPYENPALFSMTIAFVGIWLASILDHSKRGDIDRAGFDAQFVRCQTGIGAAKAAALTNADRAPNAAHAHLFGVKA